MEVMIDPDTALTRVREHAEPLAPRNVPLAEAAGCVLSEPVTADRDHPPFDRSIMDGYAVRVADAGGERPVAFEVAAGAVPEGPLPEGAVVRIMTGAPCPAGTETVVPVEDVTEAGGGVTLPTELVAGRNVMPRGREAAAGATVLPEGSILGPVAVAVLASVGRDSVKVVPRPRLAMLTTGDEIVHVTATPGPGQIRDSNGPMIEAAARLGGWSIRRDRVPDDEAALRAAIDDAADVDILLLSGGVSAGRYDRVPDILAEAGADAVFHKVTQKPGKPLLFATRPGQMIFGLPGNPLSGALGFHRYVAPAARGLQGLSMDSRLETATLTAPLTVKGGRTHFVPARLAGAGRALVATPCAGVGSADIFTPAEADAYLHLPPGSATYASGSAVDAEWMDARRWM